MSENHQEYWDYERVLNDRLNETQGYALKMFKNETMEGMVAYQYMNLFHTEPKAMFFSAWSKAVNVTGVGDDGYSFYIDVTYTDWKSLWGQQVHFSVGSHDWEYKYGVIFPEKPILFLTIYCIFRWGHTGTVYFDDIFVGELKTNLVTKFDKSFTVARVPESLPPIDLSKRIRKIESGNGLALSFDSEYGSIIGTSINGTELSPLSDFYVGGVFVKDFNSQQSNNASFILMTGSVLNNSDSSTLEVNSRNSELMLSTKTTYRATNLSIDIECIIENIDSQQSERALTVYIGIPISDFSMNWLWGDFIRMSRSVKETSSEFSSLTTFGNLGSNNGLIGLYPLAALATRMVNSSNVGIGIGVPADKPRIFRLAFNPGTRLLYVAFDIGLSALQTLSPNKATVQLSLFKLSKTEDSFGKPLAYPFRSAIDDYSLIFPDYFKVRIPNSQQGLWVAFSDLTQIEKIEDFGIGVHQIGDSDRDIPFGAQHNIRTFRYLTESSSAYIHLQRFSPQTDPSNYTQVIQATIDCGNNSALIEYDRVQCQTALVSGIKNKNGFYNYQDVDYPWCTKPCAVFIVNSQPGIRAKPPIPLNYLSKEESEWNEDARNIYLNPQHKFHNLSGEFFDSWGSNGYELDFSQDHLSVLNQSHLCFTYYNSRVGMVEWFSSIDYVDMITKFLHEHGGLGMSNGVLSEYFFGFNMIDNLGTEVVWINYNNAKYAPYSEAKLSFIRTLAYKKPYSTILNVKFSMINLEFVETYFRHCAFYAIYPSFFSADAMNSRYWDNPLLYNPHRELFKKYIPLIKKLNENGWEPDNGVRIYVENVDVDGPVVSESTPSVIVERYSTWPQTLLLTSFFSLSLTGNSNVSIEIDTRRVLREDIPLSSVNCTGLEANMVFDNITFPVLVHNSTTNCSVLRLGIPMEKVMKAQPTTQPMCQRHLQHIPVTLSTSQYLHQLSPHTWET
ncbi:predicted protein [Naegleria gruberi]|uniref:Predicted protein n=1 Tax=Naegleria gruberi TaxID=5762 RepID=D2V416_NAEGR|nr:uncharacterized protein NAEGRDRAFT_63562 [Naegleria gruberi]EFC48445.1 predicted protein [Naegleria gruberi]|eukprot:XP_002681189.1 predicted protein [Naegleria gruberi strain NEG-M]